VLSKVLLVILVLHIQLPLALRGCVMDLRLLSIGHGGLESRVARFMINSSKMSLYTQTVKLTHDEAGS
jgi:hypothetical protein